MKNTKLTIYTAIACLGACLPLQAATTIIDGFSTHSGGALAANNIDGDWHGNGSAKFCFYWDTLYNFISLGVCVLHKCFSVQIKEDLGPNRKNGKFLAYLPIHCAYLKS